MERLYQTKLPVVPATVKFKCPICGEELQENHSTMWTGMRNQILMYKFRCTQRNHSVEIKVKDMETFWRDFPNLVLV